MSGECSIHIIRVLIEMVRDTIHIICVVLRIHPKRNTPYVPEGVIPTITTI